MNRTLVFATALATGLAASSLLAQAPATAPAPAAAPTAPAAVAPQAIPAKVAIIAFEQGVVATNEGQKAVADVQKKYEPKKNAIDVQSTEIESLKKQYQALPATLSDEERAKRLKDIDTKQKEYQRDVTQAVVNAYNVASGVAAPAPTAPAPRRTTPSAPTPHK
jgi:Skp family chaperone for outer membrane proteins